MSGGMVPHTTFWSSSQQAAFVEKLESRGQDATAAVEYLETLEGIQAEYVDHREKLERQVMILVRPRDN